MLTNHNYAFILFKSRYNETKNEIHWKALVDTAELMSNSLPNIAIGYSDVSMLSPTASKFNISDIPTLRLYIYYPNFIDYSGDLSARSISSWLKKIVNEPALNIENLSTLEDIREQNNPIVVFIGKIGTSSYTKFQEVTRSMHRDHEISFWYVNIETASISLLNELK